MGLQAWWIFVVMTFFCVCHAWPQYVVGDEPWRTFWFARRHHDHGRLHDGVALHDEYLGCRLGRFAAHIPGGV